MAGIPVEARAAYYTGKSAGGHHGLVIEEGTGRTVALTYEPKDAQLLAAAPDLLAALGKAENGARQMLSDSESALAALDSGDISEVRRFLGYVTKRAAFEKDQARAALARAKGVQS